MLPCKLCCLFLLLQNTTCFTPASSEDGNGVVPYFSGSGLYMSGESAEYELSGSGEQPIIIPMEDENETGSGNEQGIIVIAFSL